MLDFPSTDICSDVDTLCYGIKIWETSKQGSEVKKKHFPVLHWFTMVRALDIENVSTFGSQGSEKAWLHISFQKINK